MPVPLAKLSLEMEAALGAEVQQEPMSVSIHQERFLEKLNLDGLSNWSLRNTAAMRELILAFHDIFTLDNNELGCTSAIEHEICINDSEPFKEWFRCIPPPLLEEVHALLHDMLDAGAICPSQSPWCSMVVLVHKKDRTLHFCIDFHHLNTWTKKDSYPLLQIQEAIESMAGATHFFTMDFKSGFWQIKMATDWQQYTAFTVGNLGHYECICMPFCLCNAPATFQCLMQNMLGELSLTFCIIHLNNVIVFGHTEEEHLQHLHIMFEWFCEFNLKLKLSKCSFFQLEIVYLAHHVSQEVIHPSRDNVCTVEEFPMPETYTQVCAFCRLVGHYRQFIKGLAHIVWPLYDVFGKEVKMGPVQLPPEVHEAVRILKDKIQATPMLVFSDFDKTFLLETASKEGLGTVLLQKQDDGHYHHDTFGSHSLMPPEKNYHSSKLEFKEYVTDAPFVVRTDNNPLNYFLTTPN